MSSPFLERLDQDEAWRARQFPWARDRVFLAHAAVAPPAGCAVEAMEAFNRASATGAPDYSKVFLEDMDIIRAVAAKAIGGKPNEVALLGPTSVGLSLVANGIDWRDGDEVICYVDDYPANVYPWQNLRRLGVTCRYIEPEMPGHITPELVERTISDRTRLVALASCHFLSGYRIDVDAIGRLLHERNVLFCLDAIQSVGAFPTSVEHVDFLSADAHKWMLGPLTAGIFWVREELMDQLRPSLLGAWNVHCPQFVAQDEVTFEKTARRYEPGVLNAPCLVGMKASLELIDAIGINAIAARILELKTFFVGGLRAQGWTILEPTSESAHASGITTITHPERSLAGLNRRLLDAGVVASPRSDREKRSYLRFSHHFSNTRADLERVLEITGS